MENYSSSYDEEPSMEDLVKSMEEHIGRPRHIRFSSDVEDLESKTKTLSFKEGNTDISLIRAREKLHLHHLRNREGFSKSFGELSSLKSGETPQDRDTAVVEDSLYSKHLELLDNARRKFQEIEAKYPQVFSKNSLKTKQTVRQTQSLYSNLNLASTCRLGNSQQLKTSEGSLNDKVCSIEASKSFIPGFLNDFPASVDAYKKSTPSLSKVSSFEESCDSAFDFEDGELSKGSSTPPSLRSPSSLNNRSFTYSADGVDDKSDKDSGISTDRPYRSLKVSNWPKPFQEKYSSWRNRRSLSAIELRENPRILLSQTKKFNTVDETGNSLKSVLKKRENELELLRHEISLSSASSREKLESYESLTKTRTNNISALQQQATCSIEEESDSEDECKGNQHLNQVLTPEEDFSRRIRKCRTSVCSFYSQQSDTQIHRPREIVRPRWTSVPNIPTYMHNIETKLTLSGIVIPVGADEKKHHRKPKFGRRSGLYILNDSIENDSKKKKTKKKSYKPKNKGKKKNAPLDVTGSMKRWFDNTTAVSQPIECQCIGRIVQLRKDIDMAHQIELMRPPNRPFGFFIQQGYKHHKEGVFVSRMLDRTAEKFLAGLLGIGDEIIDINGVSVKNMKILQVHELIGKSSKLLLTVLPFLARKDW